MKSKTSLLIAILLMFSLVQQSECTNNYAKTLSQLKRQDSLLRNAVKEIWWDTFYYNTFCFSINTPSMQEILRMKKNVEILKQVVKDISECIKETDTKLQNLRRESNTSFPRNSNNPGLEVAAAVIFLPFLLLSEGANAATIKKHEQAIKTMKYTLQELQTTIFDFTQIINDL